MRARFELLIGNNMNRFLLKALSMTTVGAISAFASAQIETVPACFDPDNMTPVSSPYLTMGIGNSLMQCVIGTGGTVVGPPVQPQ